MLQPTATPIITVLEHQPVAITPHATPFSVTPAEVAQLAQLSEMRRGFCEIGQGKVTLAQYCGVVSLGGRILEILPKIQDASESLDACRGVLLRLLRLAGRFPQFRHKTTGQAVRKMSLLDAFISAYFDSLAMILRGGLLKQYLEQAEDVRVVRGRINLTRQLVALGNRSDVVACDYDDLTVDNVWNRTLKCAVRCTRPWIGGVELGRRWAELMGTLEEVSDVRVTRSDVDRLVFNRHADRYRDAIVWAKWILSLLSPSLRAGQNEAPALLFDMNRLFESAVATVLQRRAIASKGISVARQDTSYSLATIVVDGRGSAAYPIKPDLVIRRGSDVVGVLDTKWKIVGRDRQGRVIPNEDDMYQMTAYALAIDCREVALVYPLSNRLEKAGASVFQLPTPTRSLVHVIGVDVGDDALPVRYGRVPETMTELLGSD